MKKFLLGNVVGMFLLLGFIDVFTVYADNELHGYMPNGWNRKQYTEYKKAHPHINAIDSWMLQPSIGLNSPLTKRCTKDLRGKTQTRREYFGCNAVQTAISDIIFGEYSVEIKKPD